MINHRIYVDSYSTRDRIKRAKWAFVHLFLYRPFITIFFNRWRIFVLRMMGAKIGKGCKVGVTTNIWAPWNLVMGDYACLADGVDCYSAASITLGNYSTVSQRAYLCAASHDISSLARPLVATPIEIGDHAWICGEAFIGPGVEIKTGAVIAARSVIVRDVDEWAVMAGNPARKVKNRILSDNETV